MTYPVNYTNIFKVAVIIPLVLSILNGCAAVVASTAATGVMVAQDRRSTGTIVDDKGIEFKAVQAVHRSLSHEEKSRVSVTSYNNRVLLLGQAPSEQVKSKIEETVKRVANVKQLHNEMTIGEPTPLLSRTTDSVITTKIKSAMVFNKSFNPTRAKVITENGIVYLLGIVSPEEEEIAVDIARHTKGVKKVVKIFEYKDEG
tara:strand:- start:35137 stop:35739 length:603 start_codon:yes stop_codon:yes gene_type:complete